MAGIITALMLVRYPAVSLPLETLASEVPHLIAALEDWLMPRIDRVSQLDPARIWRDVLDSCRVL